MADSGAERQRRYEKHRKGDHRFCRPETCPDAPARAGADERDARAFAATVTVPGGGAVARAVHGVLETLSFGEGDPRVVTAAVALRLADCLDQGLGAAAPLSQELERCLAHLLDGAEQPPSALDELRARHHARKGEDLIEWARGGGGA